MSIFWIFYGGMMGIVALGTYNVGHRRGWTPAKSWTMALGAVVLVGVVVGVTRAALLE